MYPWIIERCDSLLNGCREHEMSIDLTAWRRLSLRVQKDGGESIGVQVDWQRLRPEKKKAEGRVLIASCGWILLVDRAPCQL